MSENNLTLDEMICIAKKVPKWNPSQATSEFPGVIESFLMDGFSARVYWSYEGEVDGLKVFLDKSARGSNWHDYLRLGIAHGNEFIGYSGRLKESQSQELASLYKKINDTYAEQKRNQKEQQVADGLRLARQTLS